MKDSDRICVILMKRKGTLASLNELLSPIRSSLLTVIFLLPCLWTCKISTLLSCYLNLFCPHVVIPKCPCFCSIQYVLSYIDTCIQYGEDADVKVRDFEPIEDED
jgi:hypothetical protein